MWAAAHGQIAVVEFLLQNVRKMLQKMYMCSYLSTVEPLVKFLYLQPTRCSGKRSKNILNAFHFLMELGSTWAGKTKHTCNSERSFNAQPP